MLFPCKKGNAMHRPEEYSFYECKKCKAKLAVPNCLPLIKVPFHQVPGENSTKRCESSCRDNPLHFIKKKKF